MTEVQEAVQPRIERTSIPSVEKPRTPEKVAAVLNTLGKDDFIGDAIEKGTTGFALAEAAVGLIPFVNFAAGPLGAIIGVAFAARDRIPMVKESWRTGKSVARS
jgi:hypothetical protein